MDTPLGDLHGAIEEGQVELGEVLLDDLALDPGLNAAAAPGSNDDAHGHFQHILQGVGEEVGSGAGVGDHVRSVLRPGTGAAVLHVDGRLLLDIADAEGPGGLCAGD